MTYNRVSLEVYSSGTTRVPGSPLRLAQIGRMTGYYPGAFYGSLDFFVPADVTADWPVKHNYRIVAYNGLQPVWEGFIVQIGPTVSRDVMGWQCLAIGAWADLLMPQTWHKPWVETRIDEDVWRWDTTTNAAEKCTVDRLNRIRLTPKAEAWNNNEYARMTCTAPTGLVWKRVQFSYDFAEVNNWKFAVANGAGTDLWSVTATGTGSQNITLGANEHQVLRIYLQNVNGGALTPASDGTVYGQLTILAEYTETSSINLTEIAKDIRAHVTSLSAYEGLIGSNTYNLVPAVCEPGVKLADFLLDMASFGDASFNPWAVGVKGSWLGTDNLPVLFAEQYPALTDYDYHIRLDAVSAAQFMQDSSPGEVTNWLGATYRLDDGRSLVVSPDDDAALTDATSVAAYGRRDEWLDVESTSVGNVKNWLKRVLAARKDVQVKASNAIPVVGYIRAKNGRIIPACEIEPGKRIQIDNYLGEINGADPIFLVTATEFEPASQTAYLSLGRPDPLDVYMARRDAKR